MKNVLFTLSCLLVMLYTTTGCGGADQSDEPTFFQNDKNTSGISKPSIARGVYILNDYTGLECDYDHDNQWWTSNYTNLSSYLVSIYPNVQDGSNNDPQDSYRVTVHDDPLLSPQFSLPPVIFTRADDDPRQVIKGNLVLPNGSTKYYEFLPTADVDYDNLGTRRVLTAQQFCYKTMRDNVDALNYEEGPIAPDTAEVLFGNRMLEKAQSIDIPGTTAFITVNQDIGAALTLVEGEENPTNFVEVIGQGQRILTYKFQISDDPKLASFDRAFIRTGALPNHTMFAYVVYSDDPLADSSAYLGQTVSPDTGLILTNLTPFATYYIIFVPPDFNSDVVNPSFKIQTDFGTEGRTVAFEPRPFKYFIEALVFQ